MVKYFIGGVAVCLFLHHIVCTILYNAPVNPLTNQYQTYVSRYMNPLWTQKWLLFAPDPATSELKLWYRVKSNAKWSDWNDPEEPVLKKHQHIRFTYNAKLLYVYSNIARDLSRKNEELNLRFPCATGDTLCKKRKIDSLRCSSEFLLAERYVKEDLAKGSGQVEPSDSLQIMLILLYSKQYSERMSNRPFGYANATEFPPTVFNRP